MYRKYKQDLEMSTSRLRCALVLGSTREGRLGLRVAKFMKQHLESHNYDVDFFDPLELKFPMLEKPIHFYPNKEAAPEWLQKANAQLEAADAYVVVAAEYNHSMPPALSNMFDHFPGSIFSYKPSAIVTYSPGIFGGCRSALQVRCFLSEMGCLSVSNIFSIPEVHKALDEDGKPLNDHMDRGAERLLVQLDWMATAMKNHRTSHGLPPKI